MSDDQKTLKIDDLICVWIAPSLEEVTVTERDWGVLVFDRSRKATFIFDENSTVILDGSLVFAVNGGDGSTPGRWIWMHIDGLGPTP